MKVYLKTQSHHFPISEIAVLTRELTKSFRSDSIPSDWFVNDYPFLELSNVEADLLTCSYLLQGVETASQIRYVTYYEKLLQRQGKFFWTPDAWAEIKCPDVVRLKMNKIRITGRC